MSREFNINEDFNVGRIFLEKQNHTEKSSPGVPILGWIDNKHIGCWLNHLRPGVDNWMEVIEQPIINEEHITLYDLDGKLLGWIEKRCRAEILDTLWAYMKVRKRPEEVVEVELAAKSSWKMDGVAVEKAEINSNVEQQVKKAEPEFVQLSLF